MLPSAIEYLEKLIFRIDANLFICLLNFKFFYSYKFNLTPFVFGKCKLFGNRFKVYKKSFRNYVVKSFQNILSIHVFLKILFRFL